MAQLQLRGRCGLFRISLVIAFMLLGFGMLAGANRAEARQPFAAIVVDARTGKVIFSRSADGARYPASLTKVMTLYLLFEDIKAGKVKLGSRIKMSRYAAGRPPSKLGLRAGSTIKVETAIKALIVKSANDISVAIAEHLEGSEAAFAQRMTRKARELGMTRTTFKNANGLPNGAQKTTARDMATLGLRIQHDFPKLYRQFATRSLRYGKRNYRNYNRLLGRVSGVDGIKTGYTRASGYNLLTSARRGRQRIVAVVMGAKSGASRNRYMTNLVNRMFAKERLAKGVNIALVAGSPPGYRGPGAQRAIVRKPPLPRSRPTMLAVAQPGTVVVAQAPRQDPATADPSLAGSRDAGVVAAAVVPVRAVARRDESIDLIPARLVRTQPASGQQRRTAAQSPGRLLQPISTRKENLVVPAPTDIAALVAANTTVVANDGPPASSGIVADLASHATSWNIQIGAYPSRQAALARLKETRAEATEALKGKSGFTMEILMDGSTYHRARFSGFTKEKAESACQALAERGVSCFTLAPRG